MVSLPTVSVVLSFRNEEDVLIELINRLRAVLDTEKTEGHIKDYELIFVNDASTDNSEKLLLESARDHQDIKILNMSRRFGVSPCVLAGMEYSNGDLIIYMDADLQDPPEIIPDMIRAWREQDDVDIVHTQRISRAGESRIKLWITNVGYRILRRVSNIDMQIEVGDFKLLSRRAVDHLVGLRENSPFLRGLVYWIGFKQVTIQYQRAARFAGETKFPIYSPKVIRNFLYSALISFSDLPLQLCALVGLLTSGFAFLLLLYVLSQKIQGYNLPGWTAIMVATLFLSGIQLLSVGTLGLYISAIFTESKRRPNYIVKSTFGFHDEADLRQASVKRLDDMS
jgi:glycosyltransferase involved in cell wall biosynthesis